MAYQAKILANEAGKKLNLVIRNAESTTTTFRADSLVSAQTGQSVMGLMAGISEYVKLCNDLITTPGLDQFFKDAYDDQTYDVQAEFDPMIAALQTIAVNIKNSLPLSTNGYVEREKVEVDGSITDRLFATGSPVLINVRTDIDAFLITVEV